MVPKSLRTTDNLAQRLKRAPVHVQMADGQKVRVPLVDLEAIE